MCTLYRLREALGLYAASGIHAGGVRSYPPLFEGTKDPSWHSGHEIPGVALFLFLASLLYNACPPAAAVVVTSPSMALVLPPREGGTPLSCSRSIADGERIARTVAAAAVLRTFL